MIDYTPAPPTPPTTQEIQIYVAAKTLCLVEAGHIPPDSAAVQRVAAAALDFVKVPRIHPSQAMPIWSAAFETIKNPAICPILLKP